MPSQADNLRCFVPTTLSLQPSGSGKLSAYKFVVKDLVAIAGHTSSFGHPRWRDTHSPSSETAPLVKQLLDSGATLIGLTKMDQLAYSVIGNVGEGEAPVNPLHPERYAGGSSSGSASAVAGGIADFGIGTDTAGSIRVPAATCGIFSIRPTHGAIDSTGVIPLAQSLDVVGIFGRTAIVLEESFEVLAGTSNSLSTPTGPMEILIPQDALSLVQPELAEIVRLSAQSIAASIGARIGVIDFSAFLDPSMPDLLARVQGPEIWANHSSWVESNSEYLDEDVRTRLDRCRQLSLSSREEKLADTQARQKYKESLVSALGQNRAVAMPVMPILTPPLSSTMEERKDFRTQTMKWVAPASLAGTPQVVIPSRHAKSGQIVGISLLGPPGSDRALLEAARAATHGASYLDV